MLTVAAALWDGAGRPEIPGQGRGAHTPPAPTRTVTCILCGATAIGCAIRDVTSGNFLDWDRCPHTGDGFCRPCAWTLRHKPLRLTPHVVTATATHHDLTVLHDPLGHGVAVIVPVSRQKHVAPWARWGTVTTDNDQVTWTIEHAELLAVYAELRSLGFGETALTETEPRWQILSKLDRRHDVIDLWHRLDPWRRRPACMDIAARATRTKDQP